MALEKCKCVPWNYPNPFPDFTVPFCNYVGADCFDSEMHEPFLSCDCPNDCSAVTYPFHMSTKFTNTEETCKEDMITKIGIQ